MRFRNLLTLLVTGAVIVSAGGDSRATAQETVRVFQSKNVPVNQLVPQVEQQVRTGGLRVELSSDPAHNTLKMQGNRMDVDSVLAIAKQLDCPSVATAVRSPASRIQPTTTTVTPISQTPTVRPAALEMVANRNSATTQSVSRPETVLAKEPQTLPSNGSEPVNGDRVTSTVSLERITGDSLTERLMVIFGERFVSLDLNLYGLQTVSRQDGIQIAVDTQRQTVTAVGPIRLVSQFRMLVSVLENSNEGSVDLRTLIVRTGGDGSDLVALERGGWISGRIRVVRTVNTSQGKLREAIEAYRTASATANRTRNTASGQQLSAIPTTAAVPVSAMTIPATNSERILRAHQYAANTRAHGARQVAYEAAMDDFGSPIVVPANTNGAVEEVTIPANAPATLVPVVGGRTSQGSAMTASGDRLQTSRLREGIRTDELNEKLGRLGVNVEIQESEDMGVLIIRGPQEDVDAVMQIIDTIEQLSAAAEPEIVIYRLKNISQSAATSLLENDEVQAAIRTDRPGDVAILPIIRPNGFLLLGWGESLERTISFLDKVDLPEDPKLDQQIFQIKYAPVGTIYDLIEGYFADESGGLAATIRMVSDQRTNRLVVHASPRDMEVVAALIEDLDTNDTESVLKTKLFKLKNVLVEDLYSTLQQMITNSRGTTTSGTTNSSTRVSSGELERKDGTTIRSGILSDVRLATDQRLNLIIVSAPEDAMPLIEEMIQMLDSDDSISIAQIKIFPIQNADCQQIVTTLQTLLPSDLTSQGVKLAVAAEGEPSLIGLRFAIDSRTNSVIAIGSETDLSVVDALISRLDTEDVIERKTMVYPLRNQKADDVATAINDFLDAQQTLRQEEANAAGGDNPFSLLEEQVIVVPETERDLLIVSATPRYLDMIEQLVDRLDADIPEVMIQVLIAEVVLNSADEFGIEWGLQDSVLFDRSVASNNSLSPGVNFNSPGELGNSSTASNYSDVGGQALSAFGLGRTSTEAGFGGMVLSMSSESVSMLLRALAMQQRVEVQARPQIQTRNNKQAYILIGSRVARSSGQTVSLGTSQSNVNDVTVGTIIVVTPRIDDTDRVVIAVEAEKSKVGATADGTVLGYSENGDAIISPPIDTIQAVTEVAAYDGQTTILGGLITRETTDGERKVPWLGDVPLVGNLFKYKYEYTRRSELLIILTPHIVKTSEDLDRLKRIESSRMHWCLEDVREIHGNPRGLTSYGGSSEVVYPNMDAAIGSELPDGAVITGVSTTDPVTLPTPRDVVVPTVPSTIPTISTTNGTNTGAIDSSTALPPLSTTTPMGVNRRTDASGKSVKETSEYRLPVTLESKSNYEKHRVPTVVTAGDANSPSLVESNDEETVVRVEVVDAPQK